MRLALRCLFLLLFCALPACVTSTHMGNSERARFTGRTYVIVGASSGFGRGAAVALGREHANVVLAARRAELLEEVAGEVRAAGGQALVVPTDISDPAQVEALADASVARFGKIDVWMNIAGVGAIGRFWEIPVADYSRLIDINFKGVVYGSHTALRRFIAQGQGSLVNMGSIDSEVPLAYQTTYGASKSAVLSLGRALNQELRHAGHGRTTHVSTVLPWAADTPWWPHAANYSGHAPRMALMDGPEKIVRALLWVSLHPREELPVGWKAQASFSTHHWFPDLVERVSANIQRAELKKGAPAEATTGTLHRPMPGGTGVDGGIRQRMDQEDKAHEAAKP